MALTVALTEQDSTRRNSHPHSLNQCVEECVRNYFEDLGGEDASNLYDLVISQVEKPLFQVVLDQYKGNISRTAQALGLSRRTVLSRLKKYVLVR